MTAILTADDSLSATLSGAGSGAGPDSVFIGVLPIAVMYCQEILVTLRTDVNSLVLIQLSCSLEPKHRHRLL